MAEETLRIDTPENVIFGYRVAGIGSRFLAALVDSALILLLEVLVNLGVLLVARFLFSFSLNGDDSGFAWLLGAFGLVAFAFLWGYYIFFEMLWNGQTPGKRWVGLRVLRLDGTPITLSESIIRNLVRLVDFLPAYYGVGVIAMFVNSQSRRLGDLAAGTVVVHDKAAVTLESLAAQAPRVNTALSPILPSGQWPVEKLSSSDLELAEGFLRRRAGLSNRSQMAQRVARALLTRMGMDPAQFPSVPAELLIEEILAEKAKN